MGCYDKIIHVKIYERNGDIMSGSTFGNIFRISTWGESHGKALGVVIDGCPAGLELCEDDIQVYLDRRKPGQSRYVTQRRESDSVEILQVCSRERHGNSYFTYGSE